MKQVLLVSDFIVRGFLEKESITGELKIVQSVPYLFTRYRLSIVGELEVPSKTLSIKRIFV